jgi:hypothetical protein
MGPFACLSFASMEYESLSRCLGGEMASIY